MLLAILLYACHPAPTVPDPCRVARLPVSGPLAAEAAAAPDMVALAEIRIREAQRTGDDGFLSLAGAALSCAEGSAPAGADGTRVALDRRWRHAKGLLLIQSHEFRAAEEMLRPAGGEVPGWTDWMLLCDARMEAGDLEGAEAACQRAVDARPGPLLDERIGHLRWLWGDMEGALEATRQAAGSASDPESRAWSLTQLARLEMLAGTPGAQLAPLLDRALTLAPGLASARMLRGRMRLQGGDRAGAEEDLRAVGATVEARRGLWEIAAESGEAAGAEEAQARAALIAAQRQDRRGYAAWQLAGARDPAAAAEAAQLLAEELRQRQDAQTRMLGLWARRAEVVPTAAAQAEIEREAREILATGAIDPRVLLAGGLILADQRLLERALATGAGLWPSERRLATQALTATLNGMSP